MQLAELDLNPSHPQAFYQSQKRTEEVSVKIAGLAQLSLASRTRKGGSRCSSDAPPPHFPLDSLQGPTARTP